MAVVLGLVVVAVAACVVYGWFEAGWLRTRALEVEIPGLPERLDGFRIAHLSDFHLGPPSRGRVAVELAVDWVEARRPDLACVTGDLVSHPRGEPQLREVLRRLGRPYAVLGNHDAAVTRDPFSRKAELDDLAEHAVLLRDTAVTIDVDGAVVQLVGVDAETYPRGEARPWSLADPDADLRILLCHFPGIARQLPAHAFDLVLAGHFHAGQICLPLPGGRRVTLAHVRAVYVAGVYETPGGVMHVSPGLGTTFVPFRLFARPEATELVLRPAAASGRAPDGE
jgi:uncharacterized protein